MSDRRSINSRSYTVDVSQLGSALAASFVELSRDIESERFIEAAQAAPHSRFQTWLHRTLRSFLSDYDVNGLLGMYPMHLLSTDQWQRLLDSVPHETLLDVGAGDGGLTRHLAPLFGATTTTECSWAMASRLRKAGYTCLRQDIGTQKNMPTYDCVACLNVIDRTAYPVRLLGAMSDLLRPAGALVLATPLPLDAFYYRGPNTQTPKQRLHAPGPTWEKAAVQLVRTLGSVQPSLHLHAWTRAPYLSWGDAGQSLYALDDFVGVWIKRP